MSLPPDVGTVASEDSGFRTVCATAFFATDSSDARVDAVTVGCSAELSRDRCSASSMACASLGASAAHAYQLWVPLLKW